MQELLRIEGLTAGYGGVPVIRDVRLTLRPGEVLGIVGESGSGKSTLLQLLVRNYDANQGEILFAGNRIQAYSESSLRRQFCFLTQRVHVFSDTLRNNLKLATHAPLSDEKMVAVLQQVGLEKLVNQEQGLDLWLGDGGRPLSGGEQRR